MKSKLFILLLIFCFTAAVHAGLFDFNQKVQLNETKNTIERKYPTQKEVILSYNNVLENIRTSVVNISTEKNIKVRGRYANPFFNDPFFEQFFRGFGGPGLNIPKERVESALGSGVIISEDGYIVTNNHVVENADKIKVSIPGGKKEYEGKIIGLDAKSDLAVIKIDAENLNAITFYDSDKVKIGDVVFAIGNPFGVGETITQGIVSATGRSSVGIVEYEDFIQTDAPINPGNSGGALVNSAGYLIGINSAIISKGGGNVGIGFAIPTNMVKNIAKALIEDGKFTRAYLGVSISDINEELSSFYGKKFGALVTSVEKDMPAFKAGIKRGDLIIAINEKEIHSANELRNTIGTFKPEEEVNIKLLRDTSLLKKRVTLASQKDKKSSSGYGYNYEGMEVEPLSEKLKRSAGIPKNITGVLVTKVDNESTALDIGIREGDVIIQIENIEIEDMDSFKEAIRANGKKRFYIYRRGNIYIVAF